MSSYQNNLNEAHEAHLATLRIKAQMERDAFISEQQRVNKQELRIKNDYLKREIDTFNENFRLSRLNLKDLIYYNRVNKTKAVINYQHSIVLFYNFLSLKEHYLKIYNEQEMEQHQLNIIQQTKKMLDDNDNALKINERDWKLFNHPELQHKISLAPVIYKFLEKNYDNTYDCFNLAAKVKNLMLTTHYHYFLNKTIQTISKESEYVAGKFYESWQIYASLMLAQKYLENLNMPGFSKEIYVSNYKKIVSGEIKPVNVPQSWLDFAEMLKDYEITTDNEGIIMLNDVPKKFIEKTSSADALIEAKRVEAENEKYKEVLSKPLVDLVKENQNYKEAFEKQQKILASWMMGNLAYNKLAKDLGAQLGLLTDDVLTKKADLMEEIVENKNDLGGIVHPENTGFLNRPGIKEEMIKEIKGLRERIDSRKQKNV